MSGEETSRQIPFIVPADGSGADEGLSQRVGAGERVGHRPSNMYQWQRQFTTAKTIEAEQETLVCASSTGGDGTNFPLQQMSVEERVVACYAAPGQTVGKTPCTAQKLKNR